MNPVIDESGFHKVSKQQADQLATTTRGLRNQAKSAAIDQVPYDVALHGKLLLVLERAPGYLAGGLRR